MKRILILFLVLLACSSAQARVFSCGVFVYRASDQVKVDIYDRFGEDRLGLSVPDAIAFLKTAPHSRGANQIGVVAAEDCISSDWAALLKSIIDGEPGMKLVYFEGFGSHGLHDMIEQHRKASHP